MPVCSLGSFGSGRKRSVRIISAIQTFVNANAMIEAPLPQRAISHPASSGPRKVPTWNVVALKASAAGTFSRLQSCGISAWRAGNSMPKKNPCAALKPISKPTPPPALSGGSGGGGADPDEAVDQFLDVLARFNYSTDRHDARMQLIVLTRVNPQWFKWEENPQLGLLFGQRKRGFGPDLTYAQWREHGLALARRSSPTTFYVARGPLYREVLTNWYQRPNPQELVFYKRLNNTPFMVSYRADGTVLDYGAFPEIDWRTFIEVPAAIWK